MSRTAAPPRITHVVRQFWPQHGGLEESVHQLCRALRRDFDTHVNVVTLEKTFSDDVRHPATDTVDGIPVCRLPYHGSNRYPIAPGFVHATAGSDLIHVHAIDFFFDGFALARPFRRQPLVASTHGGFFHTRFAARLKMAYFATVTRAACRAYDLIGASSESDAARFRAIAPGRVEVIENGVDTGKWANRAARTFTPTLIGFGRWSSNKRVGALFPLLAALRRNDADWRLILAGTPFDVGCAQIESWAAAAGVTDAVEIHVTPNTVALGDLIGRASFFVSLSEYEGFGIAAIEAMSAGLVPLLSDIPSYRQFVERSGVGAILPDDSEAAAACITAVASRAAANAGAARAAAMAGAARYGWRDIAARWQQVYDRSLAAAEHRHGGR